MKIVDMRRDSRRRFLGVRYGRPRLPFVISYIAQMPDGTHARYLRSASAAGVERLGSRLAMFPPGDPRIQHVKVSEGIWDVTHSFECFKRERQPATERQLWLAYNLLTFVPPAPENDRI